MIGYQNFGDAAILLTFGEVYTEKVQLEVRAWAAHLRKVNLSYVADLIPAYTTLTILYKPSEISYEELPRPTECRTHRSFFGGRTKLEHRADGAGCFLK